MKILISTDIEGVAELTDYKEANKFNKKYNNIKINIIRKILKLYSLLINKKYKKFQKIMTYELLNICKILKNDNIVISDAHGDGRNLKNKNFNKNIKIIKGFTSSLDGMVKGIDSSFDGVILHGYHSGGGTGLSPVAHTFNSKTIEYIKLNGKVIGETTIALYTCALYNVPVFYIEGDEGAVLEAQEINKNIISTVTKSFNKKGKIKKADEVLASINKDLTNAIKQLNEDKTLFLVNMPNKFNIEIQFKNKNHRIWQKENIIRIDEYKIKYSTSNFVDILKLLR
ncbi:MAG: M55 family metallopeptidase [Bacilli bacterium]